MENAIVISINGQKAVDVARAFCAGCCTRGIYAHGKRIAQLEVVLDDDGTYNGIPIKWVDVTVIIPGEEDTVMGQLARLGFAGCPCIMTFEDYSGSFATQSTELCAMHI